MQQSPDLQSVIDQFLSSTVEALRGWIDLHSHFLPGVDDGCIDAEESLAGFAAWQQLGCAGWICTPHMGLERYVDNVPNKVDQLTINLQQRVAAQSGDYRISSGGELRLTGNTTDWFAAHGIPTLGNGRWVLVDYWGKVWPDKLNQILQDLLDNDYQVLLAHPERMALDDFAWSHTLKDLTSMGVKLQGNFKSFADDGRPRVLQRAWELLNSDAYYVLASDSHGRNSWPSRMKGLLSLTQQTPLETLQLLLTQRSQAIAQLST